MSLFIDSHSVPPGVTAEELAQAHARTLEIQEEYGVRFLKYWFDAGRGRVFCLVLAPDRESALAVHRATGEEPDDIFEVQEFQ